ncbi:MAG: hypothetical protein ACYS99_21720, partial [Planctomycetota bacterium]
MNRHALLIPLLAALLVPAAALASDEADLNAVVAPDGWAGGDHGAALRTLAGVVERNPESPLVRVALAAMRRHRRHGPADAAVTDRLLAVVKKGVTDGENDEALRRYLVGRLREGGRLEEAAALAPERGYVRQFAVVGPFGFGVRSLLDRPFEPETTL